MDLLTRSGFRGFQFSNRAVMEALGRLSLTLEVLPCFPYIMFSPSMADEEIILLKIDIYTTPMCPYCDAAKRLLDQKGAAYDEIGIMMSPERRGEMEARSGGSHTVPQIFIGDIYVGGCDELYALDGQGGLDSLLNGDS